MFSIKGGLYKEGKLIIVFDSYSIARHKSKLIRKEDRHKYYIKPINGEKYVCGAYKENLSKNS